MLERVLRKPGRNGGGEGEGRMKGSDRWVTGQTRRGMRRRGVRMRSEELDKEEAESGREQEEE